MSGQDFERAAEVFEELAGLSEAERAAALARYAGEGPAVLELLQRMLEGERELLTALDRPALSVGAAAGGTTPERIGPYRIQGLLGRGGMGAVFDAVQETPRRRVALKLLRPGFVDGELLRRFRHEAEVLGWLNHPGIAQVYEAGTAETGSGEQPFIAMELVRGEPIDAFAARTKLSVRRRLELVVDLCDAVHHAHQKGVVHRDLKPANVFVTDEGRLKVLDFGIARIVGSDLEATARTQTGELLGTLPYMSPEQVSGDPAEVDTRTDVYSIGVIAYELLCGQRPLDLRDRSLPDAARAITEEEPTTLGVLRRDLRGDVEIIVGRALEKEKARRYQSALELAADLRRHLQDEPILARAPSRAYQLRKFARRNKGLVAGVALAFLVLLAGAVTSTTLYLRSQKNLERALRAEKDARLAAEEAKLEADLANEVSGFLEELFEVSDPSGAAGASIPALELLDRGRETIGVRLADQPEVRSELMAVMGRVYFNLGQYETSAPMLEDSIRVMRASAEADPAELAHALFSLGEVRHYQGELAATRPLYEEALALAEVHLAPTDLELARMIDVMGRLYRDEGGADDLARARELAERAQTMRRENGADPMALSESLQSLAFLASGDGDVREAERLAREALAIREGLGEEARFRVPELLHCLATLRSAQRDLAGAEELYLECIEKGRAAFGDTHVFIAHGLNGLSKIRGEQGRFEEAEALLREARSLVGPRDAVLREALTLTLAFHMHDRGELAEAEELYRDYVEETTARLGADHSYVATGRNNLGTLLREAGRPEEAEAEFRAAIRIHRAIGPTQENLPAELRNLSACLTDQGRHEEAVAPAEEAVAQFARCFGPGSARHLGAVQVLVAAYENAGDREAARVWSERYRNRDFPEEEP